MKITRPFSPVTITLETEQEYEYLINSLHKALKAMDSRWKMCHSETTIEQVDLYGFIHKLKEAVK